MSQGFTERRWKKLKLELWSTGSSQTMSGVLRRCRLVQKQQTAGSVYHEPRLNYGTVHKINHGLSVVKYETNNNALLPLTALTPARVGYRFYEPNAPPKQGKRTEPRLTVSSQLGEKYRANKGPVKRNILYIQHKQHSTCLENGACSVFVMLL